MPASRFRHHPGRRAQRGLAALSVVLIYAAFAALWILFSDQAVDWLFGSPEKILLASTIKGMAFVAITSFLLYGLLLRMKRGHVTEPTAVRSGLPFLLLILGIAGLTCATIFYVIHHHKQTESARLQDIADLKTQQVQDWLMEREADARFIQTNTLFADLYQRWRQNPSVTHEALLHTRLDALRQSHGFYGLTLLSDTGAPIHSTRNAPPALSPELATLIPLIQKEGVIRRIGPYRGLYGQVRLDYVIPMQGGDGAPIAILHIDPKLSFFTLLQTWPGPSSSGETLLFRRDGNDVLYLNQLRHRADSAADLRLPLADPKLLAAQVLRGEIPPGVVVEGSDYRQHPVIGAVRQIAGSDWFLMVKTDREEFLGSAQNNTLWVMLAGLLAIFVSGVSLRLLGQRQQLAVAEGIHQAQREQIQSLNLLSNIAERSADAIFAKDKLGNYIFCNRAAEEMSELTPGSLLGKDDALIFPPEQVARIREIDQETMLTGAWKNYREHVQRSDGTLVLEVTKGPLHDEKGEIIGVFGISRDVSQRVAAEEALRESEARFHTLFDNAAVGITVHDAESGKLLEANRRALERHGLGSIDDWNSRRLWQAPPYSFADALAKIRQCASEGSLRFEWMSRDHQGELLWEDILLDRITLDGQVRVIAISTDITERKAIEDAMRLQTAEMAERNAELERFNRATVGRELDMIALKQEVNALARELGRKPPYPLAFLDQQAPSKQ